MAKKSAKKTIETLTHDADKRKMIPTAEFQSVVKEEEQHPVRVAYERRNRDLDPQLVWRGKDAKDWSDLVVDAPPLYIQEKVHPKVLIDDLLRHSGKHAEICLHDLYVSRVHCQVEVDGDRIWVTHSEGKHGTLINGERIIQIGLAQRIEPPRIGERARIIGIPFSLCWRRGSRGEHKPIDSRRELLDDSSPVLVGQHRDQRRPGPRKIEIGHCSGDSTSTRRVVGDVEDYSAASLESSGKKDICQRARELTARRQVIVAERCNRRDGSRGVTRLIFSEQRCSDAVPLAIMSEAERRSFGRDFDIGELVLAIDSNDRMRTCFFRSPFQ